MPRNGQGLYTLPTPQNPVSPGTLIEAQWANTTMDDLAQAMTDSVDRAGTGSMTGPLILDAAAPTQPLQAISKSYVDGFVAYSSGLPVGAIVAYAAGTAPGGFLLCNGQAVSRVTYVALFNLIGTSFGAGDGSTTFNVPNLVDQFIRGRNPATRTVGSTQLSAFGSHIHNLANGEHTHPINDPSHFHPQAAHAHTATQVAHSHTVAAAVLGANTGSSGAPNVAIASATNTGTAQPAITVDPANPTIGASLTGINGTGLNTVVPTIGATGDTETRPQNMALDLYVKAVQDSGGPTYVSSIASSDTQMISITGTATVPILNIKANVGYGTVKLDQNGKVPQQLLPAGNQNLLGLWDASTGQNPSQAFPSTIYGNGDTFIIGVGGTILVFDPATNLPSATVVTVGNEIIYITGSTTNPDGWYYVVATITSVTAAQVSFAPVGSITANNVQAGMQQLDTLKAPLASPTFTGNVGGVTATMVTCTPVGGVAAVNVQAAIQELDAEKVPLNGSGATGTWGISISGNAATATNATNANVAASCTGNAATATAPQGGGTFVTSANIASQAVASAGVAGYSKQIPVTANAANMTAAMAGTCVDLTGGMTITNGVMAAGDAVSFYNDTAAPITLTQGGSMVLRINGANTGANRVIAAYSQCTLWFKSNAIAVCTGAVT